MSKKKNNKKIKNSTEKKDSFFSLSSKTKRLIIGTAMFLVAGILVLGFFDLAGPWGEKIAEGIKYLIGNSLFFVPLFFIIGGIVVLESQAKKIWFSIMLGIFILILGISGIFGALGRENGQGGILGGLMSWLLLQVFGKWVAYLVFGALTMLGGLILWQVFQDGRPKTKTEDKSTKEAIDEKNKILKKRWNFGEKFQVKEIEPPVKDKNEEKAASIIGAAGLKSGKGLDHGLLRSHYELPSIDLLEKNHDQPYSGGDIKLNSTIIKRTLENFSIPVEMGEVNIGPTVTQYTLKPAEGIKLSKITALSNDLSLALSTHPIRIEAPIPGRPLVGIETPNKTRAKVRLRGLFEDVGFQQSPSNLLIALGRDVSDTPIFADLSKMPHLLVAGATGAGKTIGLNSVILSLLFRNSPETLRLILVDPKRVEFPIYNDLPHLLSPVILDAQKTINVLKWLVKEMERRFDVLKEAKSRDIASYNEKILKEKGESLMPYIVLIIDELADLMASRGKEVEAGIIRLAQMARATGIHLILATQRPSVEVITGLIKANITARISFQVASQVDSRTVLDAAGAEKLLGAGDMLFISTTNPKPKRIQGSYVSEKEVKKVTDFIKSKSQEEKMKTGETEDIENGLAESLAAEIEAHAGGDIFDSENFSDEDPLYEEAKALVIKTKKASASLLQRYLRIGYARAARLIDILEKRGVVGAAEGAKPREVFFKDGSEQGQEQEQNNDDGGRWQKI